MTPYLILLPGLGNLPLLHKLLYQSLKEQKRTTGGRERLFLYSKVLLRPMENRQNVPANTTYIRAKRTGKNVSGQNVPTYMISEQSIRANIISG
jgi:hypothetical protein